MAAQRSAVLEAVLFASGEACTKKRLATLLSVTASDIDAIARELSEQLVGRGLVLIETDTELELRTAPEVSDAVQKLREGELSRDLGKAGLETLAVVLYQGSATRSEIDWIRGVNSTASVRSLLLRGLIERAEDETDKRKFRYRATTDALAHLGIAKREDLPRYEELRQQAGEAITAKLDEIA